MPDQLFKVLSADGRSCHGGNLQWPLPTENPDGSWTPGAPVTVEGPLVPCENGIHLATARQVVEQWMGPRVWVAQWQGGTVDAGNKYVVRTARLLHPTAWDERIARHFACDCAERALHLTTDPRSAEAVRVARRLADGKATREEMCAAYAAAYDAARAAYAAAYAAAYDAAYAAAYAAYAAAAAAAAYAADAAYAAYAAYADAAAAAADVAERDWQEARFLYYLKGGAPPCSA